MRKLDEEAPEFKAIKQDWKDRADAITMETLPDFLNELVNDYDHDYGTIVHAMTAGAIATLWAMNRTPQGGITGFQAGCLMWEFVRGWYKTSNQCGLRLIDYDDMLFPQYESRFEKTITPKMWESIQERARQLIAEDTRAVPPVIDHWQNIVDGQVPFGFSIKEDE